jgi:hypothetical protein
LYHGALMVHSPQNMATPLVATNKLHLKDKKPVKTDFSPLSLVSISLLYFFAII